MVGVCGSCATSLCLAGQGKGTTANLWRYSKTHIKSGGRHSTTSSVQCACHSTGQQCKLTGTILAPYMALTEAPSAHSSSTTARPMPCGNDEQVYKLRCAAPEMMRQAGRHGHNKASPQRHRTWLLLLLVCTFVPPVTTAVCPARPYIWNACSFAFASWASVNPCVWEVLASAIAKHLENTRMALSELKHFNLCYGRRPL